jgi:ABC-type uncharacterized transport system substrate-binding protein
MIGDDAHCIRRAFPAESEMISRTMRAWISGAALAIVLSTSGPALAHPHVWVSVETTVMYEGGTVTGLRQRWLFDEFYTSMAIQGLDKNGDGKYDREELAELTAINIDGLKEFSYFTFPKLGDQALEFSGATDFFMELSDSDQAPNPSGASAEEPKQEGGFWSRLTQSLTGSVQEKPQILALEFTLPLAKPVLAEAEGFNFSTQDPTFFIWFDLVKDNPIRLASNAPEGCKANITGASHGMAELQQLGDAAFQQNDGVAFNIGQARTVTVSCPR